MRNLIGIIFIVLALGLLFFVFYKQSPSTKMKRTFSPYSILSSSWNKYKEQYISDGRVLDHSQNAITTSEGQSYAMLRAVWIDDKETFDRVWEWTKTNLKSEKNNLFGWRWGQRADGSYGFLDNGGENSASDADSDIALALIFGSKRWNEPKYLDEARLILEDIWELEIDSAQGKNYLIAGNWAKGGEKLIINPSYFTPYSWRIFGEVDKERDWLSLIDPAYELLTKSGFEKLDKDKGVGLPPDWLAIDRKTGQIEPTNLSNLKTDYSFDAIRTPFRIALDYFWFGERRAYDYLSNSYNTLGGYYAQNNKLPTGFSHNGEVLDPNENPSMYATSLGYFLVVNPEAAKKIYQEKIIKLYAGDKDTFNTELPYYEQNWLWIGTGLMNNFLINLYE